MTTGKGDSERVTNGARIRGTTRSSCSPARTPASAAPRARRPRHQHGQEAPRRVRRRLRRIRIVAAVDDRGRRRAALQRRQAPHEAAPTLEH